MVKTNESNLAIYVQQIKQVKNSRSLAYLF